MTISELIVELQNVQQAFGDLPVYLNEYRKTDQGFVMGLDGQMFVLPELWGKENIEQPKREDDWEQLCIIRSWPY